MERDGGQILDFVLRMLPYFFRLILLLLQSPFESVPQAVPEIPSVFDCIAETTNTRYTLSCRSSGRNVKAIELLLKQSNKKSLFCTGVGPRNCGNVKNPLFWK